MQKNKTQKTEFFFSFFEKKNKKKANKFFQIAKIYMQENDRKYYFKKIMEKRQKYKKTSMQKKLGVVCLF